ncbi:MAG: iron-sulfur cluster assembly scaffold protein [Rhodobacteraceae bacterium]|nr:iron-sulfur cluster assembly scaffold protein [Paracoccaceae bacterium]
MTDTGDLIKLYSGRILELAAAIPLTDRLVAPDASRSKRSPLCGSTVTIDVKMDGCVVAEYGQDVKACALGQAAASVLASRIVGLSAETIRAGRDQLASMLEQGGPPPAAPFDELCILQPARDYRNRHASILLAFDATVEAIESLDVTA